jgi:hypothetical protein
MKSQNSKQHNNVVAVQPQTTFHKEDRMKNQSSLLKKTLLAAVIMACVIVPATMSAQTCPGGTGANKVLNGGFEIGSGYTITDWTVAFTADPYTQIVSGGQSGLQSLEMGSTYGENRVFQKFSGLTAGADYLLCFWVKNAATIPFTANSFEATWNDKNSVQIINSDAFGYTFYEFQVEAVGGTNTDTLSFEARNDPSYWYLDNVALQLCSGCSNLTFSPENGMKAQPSDSE